MFTMCPYVVKIVNEFLLCYYRKIKDKLVLLNQLIQKNNPLLRNENDLPT